MKVTLVQASRSCALATIAYHLSSYEKSTTNISNMPTLLEVGGGHWEAHLV